MESSDASRPHLFIDQLLTALVGAPLAHLAALYGYWARARLALGYWPYPYHPDPKSLPFDWHFLLVIALMLLCCAAAIVSAGAVLLRLVVSRERLWFPALLVVLWIAVFALLRADPGRVGEWFAD